MNILAPHHAASTAGVAGRRSAASPVLALRSPLWIAFFERVFTRAFRRDMRALRLARWGWPQAPPGAPLVVFANHPSWWDGVAMMLLARHLFPGRPFFVPMEAKALARYPFMRRLGVFGVETGSPRGAIAFLRTAAEVLSTPDRMLWLNAPSRFCDARERPIPIAPGVARLPEIAPRAAFLPLALEYSFWTERRPETLAAFGTPIAAETLLALDRGLRAARLGSALEATMDQLAADAIARDPARFKTLLRGREGVGGLYQFWQGARSALRGRRHDPRHDPGSEVL